MLGAAPAEARVKRVTQDMGLDEKTARHEVERYDGSCREFIKRNSEVGDPVHYDLVINTQSSSFNNATCITVDALRLKEEEIGRRA